MKRIGKLCGTVFLGLLSVFPGRTLAAADGAAVRLVRIWPQKLYNRQGEPVTGTVTVRNEQKILQKVKVVVWLTNGLDTKVGKQTLSLKLKGGEERVVPVTWRGRLLKPYGHAMKAELLVDGKVVDRAEDCFVTADSVWEVGIAGPHPIAYTADRVHSKKDIERRVDLFRQHYVNSFEKFFWAPDDFGNMTPKRETWYSGQARYHESKKWLRYMCEYGRRIGVVPTTYGKSIGSGTGARDIILANPEMVYGFGGRMEYTPDTEELAKWDKVDSSWQATAWANYNMNDPATVQKGIDQIIESSKMFGWAGVRFDGHFTARTGKQPVGGKMVTFDHTAADRQTAANIASLKRQVLQVFPHYVFGYNYAECRFTTRLIEAPRETIELCRGGGHIMDEYAKQLNGAGSHPWSNWSEQAAGLIKEAISVRRLGGHLFPMVRSGGIVGRYQTLFALAAGAHPNLVPYGAEDAYPRFATRYAGFLWDPRLEYVWHPAGLVIAPASVMWQDYVRELKESKHRKYLIVHLINPPAQPSAMASALVEKEARQRKALRHKITVKAAQKREKPDFSALDKLPPLKFFPEPQKGMALKVVPQALGRQWKLVRALVLDPETVTQQQVAVDQSDPYFWQITVPEFSFWTVVVIELKDK